MAREKAKGSAAGGHGPELAFEVEAGARAFHRRFNQVGQPIGGGEGRYQSNEQPNPRFQFKGGAPKGPQQQPKGQGDVDAGNGRPQRVRPRATLAGEREKKFAV